MTSADALTILKTGKNVFLTGAAGSGKTHTLRAYISYLEEKGIPVAVTASTGIAATHLGGVTIHAWSGLGIKDSLSERDLDDLETKKHLWKRYEEARVLIIDEISMLHHFRFDLLDTLCKFFKRNDKPFGGLQVVLCGDFFQLPPISRPGETEGHFAYRSKIWKDMNFRICYLTESHRQDDAVFLSVLNAIRENSVTEEIISHLKERVGKELAVPFATELSTHNINVDELNETELSKIGGREKVYEMDRKGNARLVEALIKSCLAPERLFLKYGAKVMFVKNSFDKGYSNGTLGEVVDFDDIGNPIVKTLDSRKITVVPESWRIEEDGKIRAEIRQIPLRLAWAITIHKSQGMSLDAARIDLSRSFTPGMGYVALSRVRRLEGLSLKGFNKTALLVHPEAHDMDRTFRKESGKSESWLEETGKKEIDKMQEEFVSKNSLGKVKKEKEVPTHHKTWKLIEEKKSLEKIAEERGLTKETVLSHIEKLTEEGEKIDILYLKNIYLPPTRFKKISEAWKKSLAKDKEGRLSPVKTILGPNFSFFEIRLAKLFL